MIEIEDVLVRYCRGLDDGALDHVVELFSPDGELHALGRQARGHEQIRALLAPAAAPDAPPTQHLLTNTLIAVEGSHATAESDFLVVRRTPATYEILMAGRYHDRLVRHDGSWRFARRVASSLVASRPPPAPTEDM